VLKAVIFDMDGVLIDSEPYHYAFETELHQKLGIQIPMNVRSSFVGLANQKMWSYIKDAYSLNQSVEELVQWSIAERYLYFNNINNFKPIAGIIPLLEELKCNQIKTAVASSSAPKIIELMLKRAEIHHYFSITVSGDDVQQGKPAPDIFLETTKKLNVKPDACIIIEDAYNGVTAANLAGIKCIGYKNKHTAEQDLSAATLCIDDMTQLTISIIRSLF